MVECQSFPIAQIYVPLKRRGTLRANLVREIAESILEVGQQAPILVRRDGERFVLLDGLHRLEACKALGEETIVGVLASAQLGPGKVLPSYETEIDILRQKTNRLRELRLAKEAAEKRSSVASPQIDKPTTQTRVNARRVRPSSRSSVTTLSEWLAERKNNGSPI